MNDVSQDLPLDKYSSIEGDTIASRYLAKNWQPIALCADLPKGRARRIKVLGYHYTLYRGDDGSVHLAQDRCPHRGTSLAYGWVEGDCIRCRYHGWKFDAEGSGVNFPSETATYERSISLQTHAVREYLGVIFAHLGEGDPPEFIRFPELEDDDAGELSAKAVKLPYNYFQVVENHLDEVHVYFVHREFMSSFGLVTLPHMTTKETEYGLQCITTQADGKRFYTQFHMPNAFLRAAPIGQDKKNLAIHAAWRVPIDNTTTLSVMIDRVKEYDESAREYEKTMVDPTLIAQQILDGEFTLEDVDQTHPLLPVIQDTVAMGGQGAAVDRSAEHLGQSDRAIGLLRRIWSRELTALQEGTAVKEWKRPADQKLPLFENTAQENAAELTGSA